MKGKKSFILYCDLAETVNKLPDEAAGRLFKTILAYVNDQNPVVEDLVLQIAFEPVKQQLKRDLIDWQFERQKRSESGKLGGLRSAEARASKPKQEQANPSTASIIEAKQAVTVNVTDTVNVTVNEKQTTAMCFEILKFFNFTELRNPDKLFKARAFLNALGAEKIDYFIGQFEAYKKYKIDSGEKIHSFPSFIDGGWDQENWEHKLSALKKEMASGNSKTPPTDQVYISSKRKSAETDEDRDFIQRFYSDKNKGSGDNTMNGMGDLIKKQLDKIAPAQ